jgi:DinB family
MKMIDGLLAELEQEAETTRRVLERIPQAHLSWKPHPKSMSLGQLALHVATVPGNVAELAALDTVPAPPNFIQPAAAVADRERREGEAGAWRIRRCEDGSDVAPAERRARHHGDAARRPSSGRSC